MSVGKSAKTQQEYFEWVRDLYKKKHPGGFTAEQVVDWGVEKGYFQDPKVNPRTILVKKFKSALRTCRIIDKQNRKVRGYLPAKIPTHTDENGNLIFDVVWDHIHEMSAEHAMLSFTQRDENIDKQKRSASRDVHSFVDNNPNAKGMESQFLFGFMIEEPSGPPKTEFLSETPIKGKKKV
jgi:hypothetical protein